MKKTLPRRVANRLLNLVARLSPGATSLRPFLHRLRGVRIARDVFIGDDVYIDGEYPEMIEIGERAAISMRATIIAHNKGPGRVILEKEAFVGPHVVVMCSSGKVLRIGEGAVISAGCVVSRNVPPRVVVVPAATQIVGEASVSLAVAETVEEFWAGLRPIERKAGARSEGAIKSSTSA